MKHPDLQFFNLGSFAGVNAVSDAGAGWLTDNLGDDAMKGGGMVLIDFRCLENIVIGAREAGMICQG